MRILFISGDGQDQQPFREKILPRIEALLNNTEFSNNRNNKVGLICPGDKNQVQITATGLIVFEVNSTVTSKAQIPNLTPGIVRELNGFMNEFQPDIIHAYDEGFIGLLAQFFAISKKMPFVLSLFPPNTEHKASTASKFLMALLGQIGMSDEFVKNYYNNATAITGSPEAIHTLEQEGHFDGYAEEEQKLARTEDLIGFYRKLMARHKHYVRSKRFQGIVKAFPNKALQDSILQFLPDQKTAKHHKKMDTMSFLLTGAAILGSVLTFSALKGISKIKGKNKSPQPEAPVNK